MPRSMTVAPNRQPLPTRSRDRGLGCRYRRSGVQLFVLSSPEIHCISSQ